MLDTFLVSAKDAEYLHDYEQTPEGAGFALVDIDVLDSYNEFDRACFYIEVDGITYAAVHYSGLIDSYWEEGNDDGSVSFVKA